MSKEGLFYIGNLPEEEVKEISKVTDAEGFALDEGWCVLIDKLLLRGFQLYLRIKKLDEVIDEMKKSNEELTLPKFLQILKKIKEDLKRTNLEIFEEEARKYAIKEINTATLHELIHYVGGIKHEHALTLPTHLALHILKKYKKYVTTIQTKDYENIELANLNKSKEVRIWFTADAPLSEILKEVQKLYSGPVEILTRLIPDPIYEMAENLVEELG